MGSDSPIVQPEALEVIMAKIKEELAARPWQTSFLIDVATGQVEPGWTRAAHIDARTSQQGQATD